MAARVILAIELASAFGREVIHGFLPFAHRQGWDLGLGDLPGRGGRGGRPDGAVAMFANAAHQAAWVRSGIPVVNVGHIFPGRTAPHVGNDDRAIGALAARHLLERGRRRLVAIGNAARRMDSLRIAGFHGAASAAGVGCQVLAPAELPLLPSLCRDGGPVETGVFAIADGLGVQALSALARAGVAVPEQAAVVGVDNDDISCRLARPELSSVAVPRREIGQAAAEMLASLLAGRKGGLTRFIAPLGLVVRGSSDHWAVADPELTAACALIRTRAHLHLTPEEVVQAVPLSRSTLQRRFRAVFGQTLREAIRAARLDRARRLLIDSDGKLADIARGAGFAHAAQLVHHFRSAEGTTPESWRRRLRRG